MLTERNTEVDTITGHEYDTITGHEQAVLLPEVPVIAGVPQAQGDLIILPWPTTTAPARRAEEAAKAQSVTRPVVVITGESGHDHTLAPAPGVAWFSYPTGSQTLGVLIVADDAVAVLGHIEHGDTHIGPGVYVVRRQREQADEIRMVAD